MEEKINVPAGKIVRFVTENGQLIIGVTKRVSESDVTVKTTDNKFLTYTLLNFVNLNPTFL